MLLPRVLSAIVMAVLFVCAVFVLEERNFILALAAVVFIAGWEWARLSGVRNQFGRVAFAAVIGFSCYLVMNFNLQKMSLCIAPLLWGLALYWVVRYPDQLVWRLKFSRLLFGICILVTTWCALVVLKQSDNFVVWVLLLMGLIWGADSGAYFAGRAFGKTKLARFVSPGKSWEGVFGGLVLTQVGVLIFSLLSGFESSQWAVLAIIAFLTSSVSVLGDLTESLFKRHEELKDSSHLIPGHGGVMDRVDSLTAAAPIYVLLLSVFGWL
ncbi:phosphatidate cytidylyltransferase [Marinomonas sp. CT5]|uniref:phosphatidate cytidylyltransferase n=1 Tax=Marinomonas sp. CT5 TaxID=2066133 RepID=UPI0017A430F2|nr:phosphatidate cytidylyltransferase [Marinomonas sp. CT5]NVK72861.1 phosphatidate cytidylyltransferase [Oceanospirillaceae bacterium]QUX94865.1 phosphatidate cytidylyltransferase [Marinomonas sp. CT5]